MGKTYLERVQDILNEANDYLKDNLTRTITIPESMDFVVNAFDYDGEAYTTYAKKITPKGYVIDVDDNEIDFYDLSMVSTIRIADYVKSHKK